MKLSRSLGVVLDTGTEKGIVAISEEGKLLFSKEIPSGLQNSKYLLPCLADAFQELHAAPADCQYIATGVGPGSYTGIRVAVAVAKTWAYVHKLPLLAIPTIFGLVPHLPQPFAAMIDARIGGVYLTFGHAAGRGFTQEDPGLVSLEEACRLIQARGVSLIVTPHGSLKEKAAWPVNCQWEEQGLSPEWLAKLAYAKFLRGEAAPNYQVEILYLRKTQAEIEKEKQSGK